MKFSKEEKDILRANPNVKGVYQSTIHYSEAFIQKALYQFEMGKHPNDIFLEAGFNLAQISSCPYYASKTLNRWKLQQDKNNKNNEKTPLKFLSKQEQFLMAQIAYLEEENKLLKKLQRRES